jgi:phage-related protein
LKRITAKFYQTLSRSEPVREYLQELATEDRKIVGRDIARVEFGWPIGMPLCRPIGKTGLREVRSTIKRGKMEARLVFAIDGSDMILLHGFEKNPARQAAEFATAEARWRDYLRRKENA